MGMLSPDPYQGSASSSLDPTPRPDWAFGCELAPYVTLPPPPLVSSAVQLPWPALSPSSSPQLSELALPHQHGSSGSHGQRRQGLG